MDIYGYIRVSTDKQTTENQRFEINNYCAKNDIKIDKWINEAISGKEPFEKREFGKMLKKMKSGDMIICSELSRLGRSLFMIISILNECMNRDIQIHTIKDGYRLGRDILSKVLAFAFGLSSELEVNLISQRTTEGMARLKSEGAKFGRPLGSKSKVRKLTGKEFVILQMKNKNASFREIAKKLKVSERTLYYFLTENNIFDKK